MKFKKLNSGIITVIIVISIFYPRFLRLNHQEIIAGVGISFGPGEIIFSNLEIGQTYDFGKISSQQFEVINKSDKPVDVKIYKFLPNSPKEGFEPLPDLNWIEVYPEELKNVEPGKKYIVSLKLKIPDDTNYLGKNFQFYLQARIESKAFLSIGADSRVLIKIKESLPTKKLEPEKLKSPKFEVEPLEIRIKEFKTGEEYQLQDLKIKNKSDKDIKFQIELLSCASAGRALLAGYEEFPGIESSGAKIKSFILKKGKLVKPVIYLYLTKDEKYTGKKFQFFINLVTLSEEVTQDFYVPVYIEKVVAGH